jgi:THO complex subunit 2
MELTGLLQYIVNQMKDENSLDLVILKELVEKMAGIEGLEGASEAQIEAMAGGDTLRNEVRF